MCREPDMSSDPYRYYCFDSLGQLHNASTFHADNDQAAIALIEAEHPEDTCEIWQGKRLVAKVGPTPARTGSRST